MAKIGIVFSWLVWFTPLGVHADFLFQPGGFYESATDTVGGGSPTTTTRTPIDFHAAYLNKEWIFGATYDTETKNVSGGGSTYSESRTAIGPTLGYTSRKEMGFYALATYFVSAKFKAADTSYSGSGFQIEVGYRIMLRHFGLGLQGAYRSFVYKQNDDKQITLKQTRIDPGLFLVLEF